MTRPLHIALAILCVSLFAVIAAEETFLVSDVEALPNYAPPPPATVDPPIAVDNVDNLVATLLERPLFTPGRRPPPPPPSATEATAANAAPELHARLAGMTVGPGEREALFAREGGAVVAVKEQQEIDGWTVTTIATDKVVLSSAFGERVLQPTPDPRALAGRVPPPRGAQPTGARSPLTRPAASAERASTDGSGQIAAVPKTAPDTTASPDAATKSPGNNAKGPGKSPKS